MADLTFASVLSSIASACSSIGESIFGFVENICQNPVMLACIIAIPAALTLASFAFGALRRN